MRKNLFVAIGILLAAATAWSTAIPNSQDEGALRLGPMGVAGFQKWQGYHGDAEIIAAGAAFWAEYDASWFGFDMRLGGHFGDDHGTCGSVRWENEYNMYLVKGKFRPYITPAIGVGFVTVHSEHMNFDATRPIFALYLGVRLNMPSSPFYLTFDGGYKYVDDQGVATIRNRYFFALSESIALRTGVEAAFNFEGDEGYALLDVGPAFSF